VAAAGHPSAIFLIGKAKLELVLRDVVGDVVEWERPVSFLAPGLASSIKTIGALIL
jgi:hypothetical protein